MRDVKTVSDDRILKAAQQFIAGHFDRLTVNLTDSFDLEPVDAWRRGGGRRGQERTANRRPGRG